MDTTILVLTQTVTQQAWCDFVHPDQWLPSPNCHEHLTTKFCGTYVEKFWLEVGWLL